MGSSTQLSTEEKLRLRCQSLVDLICSIQPTYISATLHQTQRDLFETLVGAAIWYLPPMKAITWSGHISIAAIQSCRGSSGHRRLSEEHILPRKVAAVELLTTDWGSTPNAADVFYEASLRRYGRFCYVTPSENKRLVKRQRQFTTAEATYTDAGIEFVRVTSIELRRIRRGDLELIDLAIVRNRECPS